MTKTQSQTSSHLSFAADFIACDAAGRPVPALAADVPTRANGGISRDGLTVTYRLRRGVRWHDVAPFVGTVFAESDAPYYLAPAHVLCGGSLARSFRVWPDGVAGSRVAVEQ